MNEDPASVNVDFRVTGLAISEAVALFAATPAGAKFQSTVTQPPTGGPRHAVEVSMLTLVGAEGMIRSLRTHFDDLASDAGESQ